MSNNVNNNHVQITKIYQLRETLNKKRKKQEFESLLELVDELMEQQNNEVSGGRSTIPLKNHKIKELYGQCNNYFITFNFVTCI